MTLSSISATNRYNMSNWGYNLKKLREELGYSQAELASLWGETVSNVGHMERGRYDSLKQSKLGKLATIVKMTPGELSNRLFGQPSDSPQKPTLPPLAPGRMEVQRVKIYTDFPFHAGSPTEPADFVYRAFPKETKTVEGYLVKGTCLTPIVNDGDTIIVDREAAVENGDIVACRIDGQLHIARLQRFDDELWLANNNGKHKIGDCLTTAKVIQVVRRL